MHEYMELAFLGTGGSWPTAQRNVPAVGLKRGSEVLLFDCGEGTQRQFQRSTLSYMAVSRLFVSHLHADHFLGLPGLVQTMGLNDRTAPLDIYGPAGVRALCRALLGPPLQRPRFAIQVHEIGEGDVVDGDGYKVHARVLAHTVENLGFAVTEDARPGRFNKEHALELGVPEGPAFGRLQAGTAVTLRDGRTVSPQEVLGPARRGRKVVYTGDCVPCEATVELARGADVLVHDSTFDAEAKEANEYGHSTCVQAAFIAKKAGVRLLYLTHISPRYRDGRLLEEQARAVFPAVKVAEDLASEVVKFPPDEPA